MEEARGPEARIEAPEESAADAEATYERFVWANLPRNFAGHFLHGMLGMTGFRLFNAPTFLPAYLYLLSGSDFFVGLGQSLQQLGGVVSPVIGATQIEHRKRVLPVAMLMGTLMRIQILGVAVAGWLLHGQALLFTVLGFLFLLGLFSGPQQVAFQLLLAKVIPISRRGILQAVRNVTGGAIAAGLAWVAGHYIIQRNMFGNGYGTTFLLAFVLTSLGLTALRVLMREPVPPTTRAKSRLFDRVREFPVLITQDRAFMYFLIAQTLATAGRSGSSRSTSCSPATRWPWMARTSALVTLAFLGADTVTNMGWGLAGDRFGFRSTFIVSVICWVAATALLMAAPAMATFPSGRPAPGRPGPDPHRLFWPGRLAVRFPHELTDHGAGIRRAGRHRHAPGPHLHGPGLHVGHWAPGRRGLIARHPRLRGPVRRVDHLPDRRPDRPW